MDYFMETFVLHHHFRYVNYLCLVLVVPLFFIPGNVYKTLPVLYFKVVANNHSEVIIGLSRPVFYVFVMTFGFVYVFLSYWRARQLRARSEMFIGEPTLMETFEYGDNQRALLELYEDVVDEQGERLKNVNKMIPKRLVQKAMQNVKVCAVRVAKYKREKLNKVLHENFDSLNEEEKMERETRIMEKIGDIQQHCLDTFTTANRYQARFGCQVGSLQSINDAAKFDELLAKETAREYEHDNSAYTNTCNDDTWDNFYSHKQNVPEVLDETSPDGNFNQSRSFSSSPPKASIESERMKRHASLNNQLTVYNGGGSTSITPATPFSKSKRSAPKTNRLSRPSRLPILSNVSRSPRSQQSPAPSDGGETQCSRIPIRQNVSSHESLIAGYNGRQNSDEEPTSSPPPRADQAYMRKCARKAMHPPKKD